MRQEWEYKGVECRTTTIPAYLDVLNTLGAGGWELCGFQYGHAWFKRLKAQKSDKPTIKAEREYCKSGQHDYDYSIHPAGKCRKCGCFD